MNLPNILTFTRLLAVPLTIWLMTQDEYAWTFWVFVIAGITDAADGIIARRMKLDTSLGRILDPVADKTLLVAVFVALGIFAHLPSWLVILVVTRDVLIVGGVLISMILGHMIEHRPIFVSKVNTTVQIILIAVLLGSLGYDLGLQLVINSLIYAVTATTVLSGLSYMIRWIKFMSVEEPF